jgi:hypothetical protein
MHLRESDGAVATLIDKVPVFDRDGRLTPGVEFPVQLEIPSDVLERTVDGTGSRSTVVRLHFDVEDQHGRGTFRVNEADVAALHNPY